MTEANVAQNEQNEKPVSELSFEQLKEEKSLLKNLIFVARSRKNEVSKELMERKRLRLSSE
ncbi:hypothetical protein [Emticicia sp.]|uniref:hypothetical protein n=1 Tax=Emticicia sp. TaxID=1930953 RepID=UPI003753269D